MSVARWMDKEIRTRRSCSVGRSTDCCDTLGIMTHPRGASLHSRILPSPNSISMSSTSKIMLWVSVRRDPSYLSWAWSHDVASPRAPACGLGSLACISSFLQHPPPTEGSDTSFSVSGGLLQGPKWKARLLLAGSQSGFPRKLELLIRSQS